MVWPERLCPFAALREFWVFFFFFLPRLPWKNFLSSPHYHPHPRTPSRAPLEESPGSLFTFPPAAWPRVVLPLSHLELQWV